MGQSGTGWQHFMRCVCATAPRFSDDLRLPAHRTGDRRRPAFSWHDSTTACHKQQNRIVPFLTFLSDHQLFVILLSVSVR